MLQVAEIGRDGTERLFVQDILAGHYGSPDEILAALRRDPQVCVMLLRIQKDEEKQEKGWVLRENPGQVRLEDNAHESK